MSNLLTTQFYKFHVEQKSKLIEFAGWDMPFSYDGTLKEHNYVRDNCGFFDVSHMGRLSCLLYTSPSPRDRTRSRMPSSA